MPHALPAAGFLVMTVVGCHRAPQQQAVHLQLGATRIPFAVHATNRPGPAFLVLHANEQTAVQAGLEAIRARGGRLVEMAQGGRYVGFEMNGETWRFDPNRIFTEAGAEATLNARSGSAPPEVLAEVRRFANAILDAYGSDPSGPIITLHNNAEGEYSAASYLPERMSRKFPVDMLKYPPWATQVMSQMRNGRS